MQGLEDVLVGHRRQAEVRAAVAEVAAVVDLVVAVEGRALRPRPPVRRHRGDRPPPGALERPREREAVVLDELVVAPLAVDPDPRLQGGVRQPAEAAEGRRGEEGAARGEAGGRQLRGALVEHGVDPGGVLDRDLPVALDEDEQDVLAAQAGQQPVAGGGAEAVAGDLAGEDLVILQAGPHRLHLVARRGRRRSRRRPARRATRRTTQTTPSAVTAGSAQPRWPAATRVTRSSASTGRTSSATTEHDRDGHDEVRAPGADRVAQRLDADPHVARVVDGVERPVERGEEPDVEHLHEHEHAQHRARDHGQHAARGGGQQDGHGDDDEELEREPRERAGGQPARLVRRDERRPRRAAGRGP